MNRTLPAVILLLAAFPLTGRGRPAAADYRFSYHLQGSSHGHILLLFPYRVYYESSASVNLFSSKGGEAGVKLYYHSPNGPGHMMRTSGFTGRVLMALACAEDLHDAERVAEDRLARIETVAPYYAPYIQRNKVFLFKIFPNEPESLRFFRRDDGRHQDAHAAFDVRFQYDPEVLNVDFNVYEILTALIKGFDHPLLPDGQRPRRGWIPKQKTAWLSPPLDLTDRLNEVARLAARVMEKLKPFKQEAPFRVSYRLNMGDDHRIVLVGKAVPRIPVWGEFKVMRYVRRAEFVLPEWDLCLDEIEVHSEEKPQKGLIARARRERLPSSGRLAP